MPQYSCGCINEVDLRSGVLHCISKCNFHIEWSRTHSQGMTPEYYKEIGLLEDGVSNNKRLIRELIDPLKDMGVPEFFHYGNHRSLLELGCGLGPYIPFFLRNGWLYEAIEFSPYAANWVQNTFDVPVHQVAFEDFQRLVYFWNAIFASHFFEHLHDAPVGLQKAWSYLTDGGLLALIVPDPGDPTNPDHFWFFDQDTLRALLERIGFVDIRMTMRKRVVQENFIYCVARKP